MMKEIWYLVLLTMTYVYGIYVLDYLPCVTKHIMTLVYKIAVYYYKFICFQLWRFSCGGIGWLVLEVRRIQQWRYGSCMSLWLSVSGHNTTGKWNIHMYVSLLMLYIKNSSIFGMQFDYDCLVTSAGYGDESIMKWDFGWLLRMSLNRERLKHG